MISELVDSMLDARYSILDAGCEMLDSTEDSRPKINNRRQRAEDRISGYQGIRTPHQMTAVAYLGRGKRE